MLVGLGNPGPRYRRTRHNVGFMVAEELLERARCGAERMQDEALVAPILVGESEVLVVRPQTFMNVSGVSVGAAARRRGIEASEILMVYDDADLPVGAIRVRAAGSPAGHRGVLSITQVMGTREIPRVRLGIGKDSGDLAERVLAPFTRAELPVVERMIEDAADAIEVAIRQGIPAAMNLYNRRAVPAGE
jgi:PTH1 family peptidyl-tRNA hydrolase